MNSGYTKNGGVSLQGGYQDNHALPSSRSARCVRVGAADKEPAKPTLFLARLYEMVEDPSTDAAIKWNPGVTVRDSTMGACAFTIVDNMVVSCASASTC